MGKDERRAPEHWPDELCFSPKRVSFAIHPVLFEEMLFTGKESDRMVIHPLIERGAIHPHVKLEKITHELHYRGPHPHPLSGIPYAGRAQYGVFATEEIAPGVDLGEYVGELEVMSMVPEEECFKQDFNWLLKNGSFVYEIIANRWANEVVFVNDYRGLKEEPNVSAEMVVHRGLYYLVYRTVRPVEKGDELLTNYGEDYWNTSVRSSLIPQ